MSKKNLKNIAASKRQLLLNRAKLDNVPFDRILKLFLIERILFRISKSRYSNRFILKGAMLYIAWRGPSPRPTKDLDLLGIGLNDPDRLEKIFRKICSLETDDGLVIHTKAIRAALIKKDAPYQGVRVLISAELDKARIRAQVDVGFGDAVSPNPMTVQYPVLAGGGSLAFKAYRPETVIAEKLHSLVTLEMKNSRMKDFFDLWYLAINRDFEGDVLAKAVQSTFEKRGSALNDKAPVGLSPSFYSDPAKRIQWKAFLRKSRIEHTPANFSAVGKILRRFLLPLLKASVPVKVAAMKWRAGGSWR